MLVRAPIVVVAKQRVIYCECVFVALGITHEKCMRSIILSSVVCPAVPYCSTLSNQLHHFRGKGYWTLNACFDFLYDFFLKNVSLKEKFGDILYRILSYSLHSFIFYRFYFLSLYIWLYSCLIL